MNPRAATALGAVFMALAAVAPELPERPPVSDRPSRTCQVPEPQITPFEVSESEVVEVVRERRRTP